MKIKDRWRYLDIVSKISNKWLHRSEAEAELLYLLDRLPSSIYVDKFMFGYFPSSENGFTEFMDEFGTITKEDPTPIFEELGIIYPYYSKRKSFFRNNQLLIPFYDIYGNVLSLSGRTLASKDEQRKQRSC